MRQNNQHTVLIVDDEPDIVELLNHTLMELGYRTVRACDGVEALDRFSQERPDLVITDISMPRMDGFELCSRLKNDRATRLVPVIFLTGSGDMESRIRGIEIGGDEFLTKPFNPVELQARVGSLLKLKRFTDDLESAEQVIFSLALACAAKCPYTNGHCQRISHNGLVVARRLGLDEDEQQVIRRGGFIHDVGKIAIPDGILHKEASLEADELARMMEHPVRGEQICKPLRTLTPTLPIIRNHHERMDGTGYPDRLEGERIPLNARIVAVVDYFDALITSRPYREALQLDRAMVMLKEASQSGHLDPELTRALCRIIEEEPETLILSSGETSEETGAVERHP